MARYDPDKHHRRSIRLRGFDYARPGAYFVTLCTQDRQCLFGEIRDGQMTLNEIGQMIQSTWNELPQHYPGIQIDAFVMMPNHVHGIIVIAGTTDTGISGMVGAMHASPLRNGPSYPPPGPQLSRGPSFQKVSLERG